MGLELRSPVIVGSSGLTKNVENIQEFEKYGAGAIVLKSIFEEQILNQMHRTLKELQQEYPYPEAFDYITNYTKANALDEYLQLITQARQAVNIPIIASINCVSASEWIEYARQFEQAGAHALELNIFILPSDYQKSADEIEKTYFDIIEKVLQSVSIPVSVKIGQHFTALAKTVITLSWTGIKGIVLFNRMYSPDIDINTMRISAANVFSDEHEYTLPLRWIALLSKKAHCDLAASTGIHNGEAAVKMLLAGASAIQICSVLYKQKAQVIEHINTFIEQWMVKHQYSNISEFKGKIHYTNDDHVAAFERVQFMKYFAGIE